PGRQYSVSNDWTATFASGADWAATGLVYGTRASDVDNVNTSNSIQNSIKYVSPNYNGLQAGALYSLCSQVGSFSTNSVVDAAVSYSNGLLKLGVRYTFTKHPYCATFGDQGSSIRRHCRLGYRRERQHEQKDLRRISTRQASRPLLISVAAPTRPTSTNSPVFLALPTGSKCGAGRSGDESTRQVRPRQSAGSADRVQRPACLYTWI
ncbi:porin, partial [Paraburkholderia sp. RL17-347-BIC-D]|uniref:porin n=1 Tax=Paraburkholderia sp. RL17-347-BIC-D TaxID=3031632 RepID=UPI0038B9D9E7